MHCQRYAAKQMFNYYYYYYYICEYVCICVWVCMCVKILVYQHVDIYAGHILCIYEEKISMHL